MKKLISVLLALVMAISVTTFAWADGETGYEGAALPTGPDMSGTEVNVTPENIQYVLDGAYGSIDGKTLVLAAGNYDTLKLGLATKYAGSNTVYALNRDGQTVKKTLEEIVAWGNSHEYGSAYYMRSVSNVTFKAAAGAAVNVAGVTATSGHVYDASYDYVMERSVNSGDNHGYYLIQNLTNITFEGITFTAKSDINTSHEETVLDGFTFRNCTFNINNTANGNQAIRYYNENNNGKVKNLVVDSCKFIDCYQGVYTAHVKNVTVRNSTFDNVGHNAVAIQDHNGVCDHGTVIVTGNTFQNVHDRVFRFNNAGGNTSITINNNVMVNCGDDEGQLFKATSLENTVSADLNNNYWDGKTAETAVANEGIRPTKIGVTEGTFSVRLTSDMLADGMAARDNGDGTYTVVTEQPAPTPEPPAPVEPEQPAHTNRRYPATTTTTETPAKGNDITSAKTFDGGVALYVGMALTSTLGMAWMGKKRAH
mgnify:CR=1 FL=1